MNPKHIFPQNLTQYDDNFLQPVRISQAQIQQVCNLINQAFVTFDPVYSKYIKHISQIQEQTKKYVQISVKQNLAFGIMLKPSNILVAVSTTIDLAELKQIRSQQSKAENKQQNKHENLRKFNEIFKIEDEIQNIMLNLRQYKKREVAYVMYFAVDPNFAKYSIGSLCQVYGVKQTFDMGYKKVCGINYNPASIKLNTILGGKTTIKIRCQQQKLDFCLIELQSNQNQLLNKFIESNKGKKLKEMVKKLQGNSGIPKSRL